MFWLQRLKHEEQDAAWAISYGDMMSLLMAVFVMIAAMSELRPGGRFASVRDAVWGAFGFSDVPHKAPSLGWTRPPSLPEQLARAGLLSPTGPPPPLEDETLRCCDVTHEADRLVIRIAGAASFEKGSVSPSPQALAAIERLGVMLRSGQARIEVRGHNGDGPLAPTSFYRDGLDLSYQRARSVVDALIRAGVSGKRMCVSACGDQEPLVTPAPEGSAAAANRRIEIVVHAVRVEGGDGPIAEKGR